MPMPLRLEVFETLAESGVPQLLLPEQIEELRLSAYENGYNAGWDDAGHQVADEDRARRVEVERQLQQLAFTYHEVRAHLLRAIEPVFEAMLATVIPAAARASVLPMAIEQLISLAGAIAETPVTLRVSPGTRAEFEAALGGLVLPPLAIVECEKVAPLQAEIAFEPNETRIDLEAVSAELRAAITRFYMIQNEEVKHA
ncbi:hypothetical protein [Pararhodobacter sp. SW119]|uniref:hypothetical protein n=1 Tax=Pararhodobacter sp. SW119 TaxID=2780075 RepID=UPI001ADFBBA7|nr:hypothetical protein [Pararhodobacter sp. SW119]